MGFMLFSFFKQDIEIGIEKNQIKKILKKFLKKSCDEAACRKPNRADDELMRKAVRFDWQFNESTGGTAYIALRN